MTGTTANDFQLTDTEIDCGVTMSDINTMTNRALVLGPGRIILPENTGPALCSATARRMLGRPATFVGLNRLGQPVYESTND